jgi:hypothetical protein
MLPTGLDGGFWRSGLSRLLTLARDKSLLALSAEKRLCISHVGINRSDNYPGIHIHNVIDTEDGNASDGINHDAPIQDPLQDIEM